MFLFYDEAIIRQMIILSMPGDGFVEKPEHVARLATYLSLTVDSCLSQRYTISPVCSVNMAEFRADK
jgi:hypothetical protein